MIRIGRNRKPFLTTIEAIKALGISTSTFYAYVRLMNLTPRTFPRKRGKYYSWDQLMDLIEVLAPPVDHYRRPIAQRYESYLQRTRQKMVR